MKTNPRFRRLGFRAAFVAAVMILPSPVLLAGKDDHVEARELLRRGEILPLARILDIAQRRVPGDVIEVELEHEDRGWEYDVKVLTSTGLVRKITLEARTGTIIKIKDD